MPLSPETCLWLESQRYDSPFKGKNVVETLGKDWMRVFEEERAEFYALAFIYQCALSEDIPVPYIAEFPDFPELADNPGDQKAKIARKFQDEIMQMVVARAKGKTVEPSRFFLKLMLLGSVYQFWREKECRPNVSEIAEFMGLSPTEFLRQYNSEDLNRAYRDASGGFGVRLPDPYGLDPVLKQNIKAKKSGFEALHHDPFADH